jgi:CHASE2 domain-containing sensor protein
MKFAAGQTGNPSGRAQGARSLTKAARKQAHEALAVLASTMRDESLGAEIRANAASAIVSAALHEKPVICESTAL